MRHEDWAEKRRESMVDVGVVGDKGCSERAKFKKKKTKKKGKERNGMSRI